jgi:hypothetical protein
LPYRVVREVNRWIRVENVVANVVENIKIIFESVQRRACVHRETTKGMHFASHFHRSACTKAGEAELDEWGVAL